MMTNFNSSEKVLEQGENAGQILDAPWTDRSEQTLVEFEELRLEKEVL